MSTTPNFSDKDILDVVHMMRASGYCHLSLDVQDGYVIKCDVTFKTRTPIQLKRMGLLG